MSKMAELYAQKELIDQLENNEDKLIEVIQKTEHIAQLENNEDKLISVLLPSGAFYLVIEIKYEDCEETGYRKYNFQEMRNQFNKKMRELEIDVALRLEGFDEKQQDYAMDNMTCDEVDEERDDV